MITHTEALVLYADTDQMGIVYHANYLRWFEQGRGELFRNAGYSYADYEKTGNVLPVVEARLRYHRPARYGDRLRIDTVVKEVRGASMLIEYRVTCDEILLASGSTRHGNTNTEGRPCPFPEAFRTILEEIISHQNAH